MSPKIVCGYLLLLMLAGCVKPWPEPETAWQPPPIPTLLPPATPTVSTQFVVAAVAQIQSTQVAPTFTPTAVPPSPISPCSKRQPHDDYLVTITKQYPISPMYAPDDLVSLGAVLPPNTVWGDKLLRSEAAAALAGMVQAMGDGGLRPQILSAYRSYNEQAASYAKWQAEQPWRADIISARPGSSEHQLGTTVDFGSPELAAWVGPAIQFHPLFANTNEGVWLTAHAHEYGFTLSYPEEGFEVTGFVYEPWHYRYVGVETATMVKENGRYLTEWQFENQPVPCLP
ncbi:MAG: M15 family metallopeptidase [Chloroflexi bacterium]|nr:M15 family metallopeptidase [Chloroflexota bacterium]